MNIIKNYKLFKESLLTKLEGPSLEEYIKNFENKPNKLLIDSAEKGYLEGIKKAIEFGANIHHWNDYALEVSCVNGYLDIVKYLFNNGVSVHTNNNVALKLACENGHINLVNYILSKSKIKESVLNKLSGPTEEEVWNTLKDNVPDDIFAISCENNFLYGIKKAMEIGVDIFAHSYKYDEDWGDEKSGLEYLIMNDNYDTFKYIFDNTEIKDYMYEELNSHLEICSYYGKPKFADILLDKGAMINDDMFDVLGIAINKNKNGSHYDMIKFLLDNGADIHIHDDWAIKRAKENSDKK